MGDVIRRSAAVNDIFSDVHTAHSRGIAKGGKFQQVVEAELGQVVATIDTVEADLADARKVAEPLVIAVQAEDERADRLVGRMQDDLWNDIGRAQSDAAFSLLFPGGYGYYAEGDTAGQPDRMELLAELLERGVHPLLTKDQVDAAAAKVRGSAQTLKAALDAARVPVARVNLLERARTALGRTAQFRLVSLKRSLKNAGFSEAEIHTVIPDRPVVSAKEAAKKEAAKKEAAKKAETKPGTAPVGEAPAVQPATQPATPPVTQPITLPATQPVTLPATQPVIQPGGGEAQTTG